MDTTKSAVLRLEASLRDERHLPSFAAIKKMRKRMRQTNACSVCLIAAGKGPWMPHHRDP